MNDRMPCEFFLIRYVPDPVKGEFTNIGVLLRGAGADEGARVRFTRDWSRVSCMDRDVDIGLLEGLEAEIDSRLRAAPQGNKSVIEVIQDSFSNSVQMTEARACLAENLITELELLMRLYVEPLRVKQTRKHTGRVAIAAAMRTQFEHAGVWGLMRKRIAASLYTLPGDPMKIDCGYRPNGVVKMFQAVSLEADVESAKVLAYSAPRLREGIARVEAAKLELTAVVEPLREVSDEDEGMERYRFGVEAMENQDIRVLTMNDLGRAAETARVELRI
jgi:hypothetical protein